MAMALVGLQTQAVRPSNMEAEGIRAPGGVGSMDTECLDVIKFPLREQCPVLNASLEGLFICHIPPGLTATVFTVVSSSLQTNAVHGYYRAIRPWLQAPQ
ncbi:predicted protein [Histoplasma capsulatum G186AR]|uniref:Uncharacterized protein n=1 Tax=Ajellomyces capsulatus (strain G186AR / H82 / ATCC MYA-2454 / RMSCC 2432) TaxID=447093 RepID=C0NX69_AJECG|nr:uncharacterized protein HCBG_08061 [Histoplasma capsulatum G186AR]EEH03935.1 predicted protein [Histoplasma capsulatum G186AR]